MINIDDNKICVQDVMNKHLENIVSTLDSEFYQVVKSLGFNGEIHELEKIQDWLDSSGYTLQLNSTSHNGVSVSQYSIKENEKILGSITVRSFYEGGKLRIQISKELGRNKENMN